MASRSSIRPLNAFYLELQRQLSSSDVTKIKDQLLHSHVDRADYERLETATQVFQYLEDRGYITTEDLSLLFELFHGIQRPHLADQVREFLENPLSPTSPLRSPLLSPTQRLPPTPLPSPSLVQSSPLQRSPPLPVSQQQQLLPFFEGSVGEKRPQQDFGDRQVAKRPTREIMIPQPHFVKGKQSMLFVNSDWSNEMHRISILSRLLADVLESEAVDRYATTLEVSDTGFTVDKSGVTVVNALESKVDILQNKTPTLDWLINYPNAIYDHMQGIENIRLVVGHMSTGSDEHLHQAGLAVHENMKKSKFFLFNHSIPEGMSVVTPDVEVAAKAEVVFSVGPTVYSHFQTQYHVPPSPKCHICFYPPTSAQLMGLKVKVPSTTGMQRILTFCEVKTTEDFKKYNEIAIAMGKVAEKFHGTKQSVPIWDVMVSTKDLAGKFREHLRKASGSPQLQVYTIPSPSNQSLVVKLQQSVLLVVPEKRDPFNYVAYFAMQAGLPVVVAKRSGMGEFLFELCPLICDAYMVDAGVHDFSTSDADNWRQKIIDNLKNQELSFERAKQVKEALANNDLIRNSTTTFVEYCRRAFQGKGQLRL
ncbi:uncharacterized protein [Ptychodera flava]|uniref:uncharacterized protein n=1 Tax=Ptychodera flava TaxID=63121 RepID=UPI003969C044